MAKRLSSFNVCMKNKLKGKKGGKSAFRKTAKACKGKKRKKGHRKKRR